MTEIFDKNFVGATFIFYIIFFFIGLLFFIKGLVSLRVRRLIEDTPTSTAASVAVGPVEVYGQAVPYVLRMFSPFSKKDCVYYKYTVEEYRRSSGGSGWAMVEKGERRIPFYIKDDSGMVMVEPDGATIQVPMDYEYESGLKKDPPNSVIEYLYAKGESYKNLFNWNKTMRFREYLIESGDYVYVLGTADMGLNPSKPENVVGVNDLVIHKGKNIKTFYISDRPERKILENMKSRGLFYIYGGIALSLFCLAIILHYYGLI